MDETNDTRVPVMQQLSLVAVVLLLIFGVGFSSTTLFSDDSAPATVVNTTELAPLAAEPASTPPTFSDVSIRGAAAYVWDVRQQRALYKYNESESLPLASLTKLMTALVAHELLSEEEAVAIDQTAVNQDGVSGFVVGETFDRQTLSDLTLVSSSNDGAYALAETAGKLLSDNDPANAFVQAMNIRATEIGMRDSYFKNPTGLDISTTEGGAYGTARDTAFLLEYILKHEPSLLTRTTELEYDVENFAGYTHDVENTNFYITDIPGLIGSKTGYTDLAGGNLAIAFDAGLNRPIIVVVLGSTRQERFNDVLALTEAAQQYVAAQTQ